MDLNKNLGFYKQHLSNSFVKFYQPFFQATKITHKLIFHPTADAPPLAVKQPLFGTLAVFPTRRKIFLVHDDGRARTDLPASAFIVGDFNASWQKHLIRI